MPRRYDGSLDDRQGYDPNFIGIRVETPTALDATDAVEIDGSPVIRYTRFSLGLSRSRKLARWVAWNIDGATLPAPDAADTPERAGISFKLDLRVDPDLQTPNSMYDHNRLDRGHIARRADLL